MQKLTELKVKKTDREEGVTGDSELESVRSILFGAHARDIAQQLEALEDRLEARHAEQARLLLELTSAVEALESEKLDRASVAKSLQQVCDSLTDNS